MVFSFFNKGRLSPQSDSQAERGRGPTELNPSADGDFGNGVEPNPLEGLGFKYPFRKYQQEIIELVKLKLEKGERELHIVAPPGAGKTIIGLQLITELKSPAIIVCPTTTIQAQWGQKLDLFVPPEMEGFSTADVIGTHDARPLKPITLLTYQVLSTPGREQEYLQKLAHDGWVMELCKSSSLSHGEAELRIMELMQNNRKAYDKELSRHVSRLRRKLSDVIDIKEVLHPNAIALLQAFRRQKFKVIVFDECHHLTDYWAAIMTHVIKKLEDPIVIGLTGTPPEGKSNSQETRYLTLVGDIDYQVPTPALVREGGLAPFQDLVYFTEPVPKEEKFLEDQHQEFHAILDELIDLQPPLLCQWVSERLAESTRNKKDSFLAKRAELAAAMVRFAWKYKLVMPAALELSDNLRQAPLIDDWMSILEDFSLNFLKVSASTDNHKLYERIRSAVSKLGYGLTERGIRKQASPVDRILAFSKSKPLAVASILETEYRSLGDRLRCAVVTDFEKMSAMSVKTAKGVLSPESGGAVACVRELLRSEVGNFINPCMVTGSMLLVDRRIADQFVEAATQYLRAEGHKFELQVKEKVAKPATVEPEPDAEPAADAAATVRYDSTHDDFGVAEGIVSFDPDAAELLGDAENSAVPPAHSVAETVDGKTAGKTTRNKRGKVAAQAGGSTNATATDFENVNGSFADSDDDRTDDGEGEDDESFNPQLDSPLLQITDEELEPFVEITASNADWEARLYVGMATAILERGITKCLIGTRGIFGEGWDCQALNTLIDLTTTTTPMSVKQLRGRSLRINVNDPLGARKVANNWDVVCIAPQLEKGLNDYQRFVRKHDGYFGISDDGQIECGVGHVHPSLSELTPAEVFSHYPDFNEEMVTRALVRDQIYDLWKVGQPYANKLLGCVEVSSLRKLSLTPPNIRRDMSPKEHAAMMRASLNGLWVEYGGLSGVCCAALTLFIGHWGLPFFLGLLPLLPAIILGNRKYASLYNRLKADACRPNTQDSSLADMSLALLSALQQVKLLPKHITRNAIKVTQRSDGSYRVFLDEVEPEHSEYFAKCVKELLAPVTNQPFLIPKYEFVFPRTKKKDKKNKEEMRDAAQQHQPAEIAVLTQESYASEEAFFKAYLKGKAEPRIAAYHPVPTLLARSEKGRDAFQNSWNKYVSPGFILATETKPEVLNKYFGLGPSLAQRLLWE